MKEGKIKKHLMFLFLSKIKCQMLWRPSNFNLEETIMSEILKIFWTGLKNSYTSSKRLGYIPCKHFPQRL